MQDEDIVVVAAKRTAVGAFNGSFSHVPAHFLGAKIIEALREETKIASDDFSEVIMGQVLTAAQGQNPARQASIQGGIDTSVPAWIINQVCGSGLRSVALGAQAIQTGESRIVLAGGQENMTMAPHAALIRPGVRMGNAVFEDTMMRDGLEDAFNRYAMGVTAENVAKKFNITREAQDQFAYHSHRKAAEAQKKGIFDREILPVTVTIKREEKTIMKDESVRSDTTSETLTKLKPVFQKEGTVTAGNASSINDGAAGVILMTRKEAEKRGLKPLVKIVSFAHAGVTPELMGTGPIYSTEKALEKAGWTIKDLDIIESNEAFAAQALAVAKELKWDNEKVNIFGGAIALGHPIGASGTRVLITLIHALHHIGGKKGLATLCVGGGMGVSMCIERE